MADADDESFLYGGDEDGGGGEVGAGGDAATETGAEAAAATISAAEEQQLLAEEDEVEQEGEVTVIGEGDRGGGAGLEDGAQELLESDPTGEPTASAPDNDDPHAGHTEAIDDDDDSDDDDVQITIDREKIDEAKDNIQSFGALGGRGITGAGARGAQGTEKKGKFAVEEFEQVGAINGVAAQEFDVEAIEDKPWRKPGADTTDYFNYGFTEETWHAYCNRQRRMRHNESGVGNPAAPIGINKGVTAPGSLSSSMPRKLPTVLNRSSTSSLSTGPPPSVTPESPSNLPPKTVPVMTSDKRTFSKKVMDIDFSRPPPGVPPPGVPPTSGPPPGMPPPASFDGPPPNPMGDFPADDPFGQNDYDYYGSASGYEPTMESQWQAPPGRRGDPPPGDAGYEDRHRSDEWHARRGSREERGDRDRDRDRDRERYERERYDRERMERKRRRSRSRSRDRDRDRGDRDRDRDRSDRYRERDRGDRDRDRGSDRDKRSSSKRGRSRSRSPSSGGKKSKKDKKSSKSDRPDREIKTEIKEEREDYQE